jgi:hypothetical protein
MSFNATFNAYREIVLYILGVYRIVPVAPVTFILRRDLFVPFEFWSNPLIDEGLIDWGLGLCRLTPLSTIFQLHRGGWMLNWSAKWKMHIQNTTC